MMLQLIEVKRVFFRAKPLNSGARTLLEHPDFKI